MAAGAEYVNENLPFTHGHILCDLMSYFCLEQSGGLIDKQTDIAVLKAMPLA